MVGVLFIITVPQIEYEKVLRLKEATNIVVEKEKYDKASKLIHELKKSRRFGSIKSSIESYATDDDSSIVISKCKSTDCLHTNEGDVLHKSKSENSLDAQDSSLKSSWGEVKQLRKLKKNKLSITRPARGVDILGAFHGDTPLETILSEILTRLDINNASWSATRDNKFWKVTYCLKSGNLCEELLQVLRTFGIGSRSQSSMSILPCTLYYQSEPSEDQSNSSDDYNWQGENSVWSRFSSSVRARNHLPQILHAVRAEASLTFDWVFLLVVAAFVSAIGLVENSTVILVASMLISPLMGPITAGTMGTAVRDRSLQRMGVVHEMLGLFLSLVIGFIFGLAISAVDERYGTGDWPTFEMVSRCEIRSLWVGVLVAIPSGAGVALAVLGEYTASLVGVAISASLLPPAVNAGLLWSMAFVHFIYASDDTRWNSTNTNYYSEDPATELALLGTVSLCLTLVNIICIFLVGVAVYKIKEVCPLDKRELPWWRTKSNLQDSSTHGDEATTWDIYSKLCNEPLEAEQIQSLEVPNVKTSPQIQSDTVTYRRHNIAVLRRLKAHNIEDLCLQKSEDVNNQELEKDLQSNRITEEKNSKNRENSQMSSILSNTDSIEDSPIINTQLDPSCYEYYNFGFEDKENATKKHKDDSYYPTIEPSLNLTVDAKQHGIILGTKSFHV
ncbi:hypothetical protein ACJJTC_003725 [Scirpophaga incertulas]